MRRHLSLRCGLIFFLLLSPQRLAAQEAVKSHPAAAMPQVRVTDDGQFRWISAEEVARLLSPEAKPSLEIPLDAFKTVESQVQRRAERTGCANQRDYVRKLILPDEIIDNNVEPGIPWAVRNSAYVLIATVTGISEGFSGDRLETLYRIRVDEAIKGPSTIGIEYFFYLPVADFFLGPHRFCAVNPTYPEHLPTVGDEVLLMLSRASSDETLPVAGSVDLITLSKETAFLPSTYVDKHGKWTGTAEDFKSWIRTLGNRGIE